MPDPHPIQEDSMSTFQFYAYVEVREWGEPDREERTGPYTLDAFTREEAEDELRANLEERGEQVNCIEAV